MILVYYIYHLIVQNVHQLNKVWPNRYTTSRSLLIHLEKRKKEVLAFKLEEGLLIYYRSAMEGEGRKDHRQAGMNFGKIQVEKYWAQEDQEEGVGRLPGEVVVRIDQV